MSAAEQSAGYAKSSGPLTVGRLRDLLSEFHESDIVLVNESNLLYRLIVDKKLTAYGTAVVISKGPKHVG